MIISQSVENPGGMDRLMGLPGNRQSLFGMFTSLIFVLNWSMLKIAGDVD